MANDDVIECIRCSLQIHRNDAKDYLGNRVAHRHERCIGLLREALRASRARVADFEIVTKGFPIEMVSEVSRARVKFPSSAGSMVALMEEVGELARAMLDEPIERVRAEAVQVAAMAMRVAEEGDPTLDVIRKTRDAALSAEDGRA